MKQVLVLQHAGVETPGIIADVLVSQGYAIQHVLAFAGQPVPHAMREAQGVVIMGGPMGVYERDRYPFIEDELHLIGKALEEHKPILGVCLGSQLLAASLDAEVTRERQKEIGWHRVSLTEQAKEDALLKGTETTFMALHWHGDIFDLPHGALRLASSDLTECQAFRYGRNAYGFLFHMETTAEILVRMAGAFEAELVQQGIDGQAIINAGREHLPKLQQTGRIVFERWTRLLDEG
jgi:GMP synthase (glutamine-hydrolysing)